MTAGRTVISVGNAVVDVAARLGALPAPGADVVASDARLGVGGAGNAMVASARQHCRTVYAGAHGTGPLGDLVRAALAADGVEVASPPTPGADTGFVVALTDGTGERTFVTAPGAEGSLTAAQLRAVPVGADDLVHVSGYGLLAEPNRSAIVDWLAGLPARVTVLYDPGPRGSLVAPGAAAAVARRTDWWSGNRSEAIEATGCVDPVAAASALVRSGAGRNAVVRIGPDGCVVAIAGATPVVVAGVAVAAIDTNGAGDTHVGVWLAALAVGRSPLDAAVRANRAAAVAVTRLGPATAPTAPALDGEWLESD